MNSQKNKFEVAREMAVCLYGHPISEGRHRVVFKDENWVVKIPTTTSGILACEEEIKSKNKNHALAFRDKISDIIGFTASRMEYVQHTGPLENYEWTYKIDGGQVGRTKDGRIVAYDWELEV